MTSTATLHTTLGDIVIELFPNHAPKTVENFVGLATGSKEWSDPRTGKKSNEKLYDGTIFHRVISGFMIQGGDPLGKGIGGPGYQFADELPAQGEYKVGSIAMANSGPNTNGSQFFVITGSDGASLPPQYTLFGEVTDGLDTTVPALDAAGNPENNGVPPLEPIVINSVTIVQS